MLLQQMAEVQDGRLIRRGSAAKVDTGETTQNGRFLQCVLGTGIGKVEPVLQQVSPQQDR